MKENQLIPLYRIIDNMPEMNQLYKEYEKMFDSFDEFMQFCRMQNKYYPNGVTRINFLENVTEYSFNVTMASLKQKVIDGLVKEYTLDDGTTYYRFGQS